MQVALTGIVLLLTCNIASAHEVDQYVLPDCEQFEDLGDYWNQIFSTAVCKGMASLNRDIELANKLPIPVVRDALLANYHSPTTVAWRVRKQLPMGLLAIAATEMKLAAGDIPCKHDDRIQSFRATAFSTAYSHFPLLPDPRQLGRMTVMRSSVIKVHDTHIGTDKIGHFIGHGHQYFLTYRTSLKLGSCREEAIRNAVNVGTYGPISENMFVGIIPTGVFSNADQAANYLGMKFYINLTETVQLNGCLHPPMLERDGDYWVKRTGLDDQYFAAFVSEHLDEVLNPCIYDVTMRGQVRNEVQKRAGQLLDWYAGNDPAKRNREYFDRIVERCTTYFGEDYGYSGGEDKLITLGEICFADQADSNEPPASHVARSTDSSQAGISIDVSAPLTHQLGDSEGYQIAVSNQQTDDFENVRVVAHIPQGLHVTTLAQPARFDREASTLTWQVPTFESGSSRVFLFIAKAVKEGNYSPAIAVQDSSQHFAAATYDANVLSSGQEQDTQYAQDAVSRDTHHDTRQDDSDTQQVSSDAQQVSGDTQQIAIDVWGPTTHPLGDTKTYEIAVFNPSEGELDDVAITAEIPAGLQVTGLAPQAAFDVETSRLTWRIPVVKSETEYVFRFKAKAIDIGSFAPRVALHRRSKLLAVNSYQSSIVSTLHDTHIAEQSGGSTLAPQASRRR